MSSRPGRFRGVTRVVGGNRALARLLLAHSLITVGEYGQWVALIVYAYIRGGASEAGLVVLLQLLPATLLAPILSARLARLGVVRLLTVAYAAATLTLACCGATILLGGPVALVYLTAVAFSLSLSVSAPLHHVLMPLVVSHPDELTSANIATSWVEGAGTLLGPALAGVLITTDGPGVACAVLALLCVAVPLLARLPPLRTGSDLLGEGAGGLADLLTAGRVIVSRPSTRALLAFPVQASAVEGAIDLLVVVLAVKILAIGPGASGYLSACFGAGGLLGAFAAVLLMGRRLALPLIAAALIGGLAMAALGISSTVLPAVGLLALIGGSRVVQTVAARTLLQRSTPLEVVVCVFALIESMRSVGMAFGALVVPILIGLGGARSAFLGMACFAPIAVLAGGRRIRRIDNDASIPIVEMGILRNTPMFGSIPAAPLETLAREARFETVGPGTVIIAEGQQGDSYYTITGGSVLVTKGERQIRRMETGEGFGEIALLHPVTRTATVTAIGETTVLRIPREAFLAAMGAHTAVSFAAGRIASGFLEYAE